MTRVRTSAWPFAGSIYGVRKVSSDEFRYVGLTTKTVSRRRLEHFKVADSDRKTPFADWLRAQPNRECVYFQSLELVMSDDLEDLGEAERKWIARLRAEGHRLLNLNDGGLGNHGYVWTDEQRTAASVRNRGRKRVVVLRGPDHPSWGSTRSEEAKARWSAARKGMNTGAANPNFGRFGADHPSFGHVMSAESRQRLSEARRGELNPNFGVTASAETRAKRSAAMKGKPRPSSIRSAHTRYHTNKSVFKDTCIHCQDDRVALAVKETDND